MSVRQTKEVGLGKDAVGFHQKYVIWTVFGNTDQTEKEPGPAGRYINPQCLIALIRVCIEPESNSIYPIKKTA